MRLIFPSLTALALSFSYAIGMDGPLTHIIKPHSIACLQGKQVAVTGENGCIIFDQDSQQLMQSIKTEKQIFDIAPNKSKSLLALSIDFRAPIIYNTTTHAQNSFTEYSHDCNVYIAFSAIQDTLFSRTNSTLYCYNATDTQTKQFDLPWNAFSSQYISCHPTKNELLCASASNQLVIAQPGQTLRILTYLSMDFDGRTWDYAPDGNTIIILERRNGQHNYFVCNLASQENPLPAHQLIADNKNYVANKFCNSMVALLSTDNHVHFFDYKTRMLIAKTKKLTLGNTIADAFSHKRLDFDGTGKRLAVALSDTWLMIDVPQNNFYEIWKTLRSNELPKEVALPIIANIIALHQQSYDDFDLQALLHVTRITPATEKEPMELEQQTKQINAIYVRPPKNYERHDHWGSIPWHAREDYK